MSLSLGNESENYVFESQTEVVYFEQVNKWNDPIFESSENSAEMLYFWLIRSLERLSNVLFCPVASRHAL